MFGKIIHARYVQKATLACSDQTLASDT